MSTPSAFDRDYSTPLTDDGLPAPVPTPAPEAVPVAVAEPVERAVPRRTVLDELREEADRELDDIKKPPLTLIVTQRPKWSVRFDPNIDSNLLKQWRRKATEKAGTREETFDDLRFAISVIQNQARCIVRTSDMEDAHDSHDRPMDFNNKEFQEAFGGIDARSTIRKFYVLDPHIITLASEITGEAGYADDVERADVEDPTQDS